MDYEIIISVLKDMILTSNDLETLKSQTIEYLSDLKLF